MQFSQFPCLQVANLCSLRHRKCNNNQMKCVCAQIFTLYLRQSNCQMMKKNIAAMKYETDPSRSGPQSIAKEVGSVDNCYISF